MPRQETYLQEIAGTVTVKVVKTYDRSYAREAFRSMDSEAQKNLAAALNIAGNYETENIPDINGIEYEDFLWEELIEAAREDVRADPNLYSFFVVSESKEDRTEDLYASPDWPSAEEFAKNRLNALGQEGI